MTVVQELAQRGLSIWLDYISRSLIKENRLQEFINLGVRGMTSNPTIFDKAISGSDAYDAQIRNLIEKGADTFTIYDELTVEDIRNAADAFLPVYEKTEKKDGYVSLEIDPRLANELNASIEEGKRLFHKVERPNLMIKVPATQAGFAIVEELLASAINVNVTLIFSLQQYLQTQEAYLRGMQKALERGHDITRIHSVASIFVSRIDIAVDNILQEKIQKEFSSAMRDELQSLLGKAAVANSWIIFEAFQTFFQKGEAFQSLAQKGGEVQRVLWASTGAKNPAYSNIKYVEELICFPAVNTLPEKTLKAFLDHGKAAPTPIDMQKAHKCIQQLKDFDIDIDKICQTLLEKGLEAFEQSFSSLLESITTKTEKLRCGA